MRERSIPERTRDPVLERPLAGTSLRCKIRSYLRQFFSANFTDFLQLVRARSRLYRSRFLQPNTHFAALFEIYKNIIPSPLQIQYCKQIFIGKFLQFSKFRPKVFYFSQFSSDFAPILMKISRNFAKFRRKC